MLMIKQGVPRPALRGTDEAVPYQPSSTQQPPTQHSPTQQQPTQLSTQWRMKTMTQWWMKTMTQGWMEKKRTKKREVEDSRFRQGHQGRDQVRRHRREGDDRGEESHSWRNAREDHRRRQQSARSCVFFLSETPMSWIIL